MNLNDNKENTEKSYSFEELLEYVFNPSSNMSELAEIAAITRNNEIDRLTIEYLQSLKDAGLEKEAVENRFEKKEYLLKEKIFNTKSPSKGNARVLLAFSLKIFLQSIESLLDTIKEVEVIGTLDGEENLLAFLEQNPADLLISDLNFPFLGRMDLIREILSIFPDLKILFLDKFNYDDPEVFGALKAGISGYLSAIDLDLELRIAIEDIMSKGYHLNKMTSYYFFNKILKNSINKKSIAGLSKKELEILDHLNRGVSKKEIFKKYNINHSDLMRILLKKSYQNF